MWRVVFLSLPVFLLITCLGGGSLRKTGSNTTVENNKSNQDETERRESWTGPQNGPGEDGGRLAEEEKRTEGTGSATVRRRPESVPGPRDDRAPETSSGIVTRPTPPRRGPSGLQAGFADDNRQFNYFLSFLDKYGKSARHIPVNIQERIRIEIKDGSGRSLPDADLEFLDERGRRLETGRTGADGSYHFYPSFYAARNTGDYKLRIRKAGARQEQVIRRGGPRKLEVTWRGARAIPARLPVDIVFVMDTTGSMGEEIARLKRTIEIIHRNLNAVRPAPRLRFGMVLYRDREDEYVTRLIPLTENLAQFQKQLAAVEAGGGGDHPEDLQAALHDGLRKIKWAPSGVRLGFVVTDAPPHIYEDQKFDYVKAALEARRRAIKLHTIGTGGLDLDGEFVLRQIAQLTRGRYIFLTYGNERGENDGGRTGSVSHHTGSNFQNEKLESIIIRFTREELAHVSRVSVSPNEEYWGARPVGFETRTATLQKLFRRAAGQLIDYSSFRIEGTAPTAVLPLVAGEARDNGAARYFSEQLSLALSRHDAFALVERDRVKAIMREISRQQTGIYNEETTARIGQLTGARFLITGNLVRRPPARRSRPGDYSLFLKLIRVETAEVLAVSEARIDAGLGKEINGGDLAGR